MINTSGNISQWVQRHARFTPNKIALCFEGQTISYAQFSQQIDEATQMLAGSLGVERGDRVSILAYNRPEYLVTLFACARLGAIFNPLNWRLAEPELLYILENADVKAILLEAEFQPMVQSIRVKFPDCHLVGLDFTPENGSQWDQLLATDEVEEASAHNSLDNVTLEDPLLLVYTSGTTGLPKGALLNQNALQWNAVNGQHMHDLTSADHVLTSLPLFHVGGLNNQTTPAIHSGATVTLHRRFDPITTLQAITHEQVTTTCLVPTMLQACISAPNWDTTDFSRLNRIVVGSTLIPEHLSNAFREKGIAPLEMYGLTETCPIAIYQRSDSSFNKRGSVGLVALHGDAQVVDADDNPLPPYQEGEIVLRGPNIMRGYWRNPEATAQVLRNGWFHTGDVGYYDEDGYFWVKDRIKNMIISGGENIYSAEVERALYEHPAVLECALVGQSDPKWGEIPVAFIVQRSDTDVNEQELARFVSDKLARYKQPKHYTFVDVLPKNAMGKILHYKIREQFVTVLR